MSSLAIALRIKLKDALHRPSVWVVMGVAGVVAILHISSLLLGRHAVGAQQALFDIARYGLLLVIPATMLYSLLRRLAFKARKFDLIGPILAIAMVYPLWPEPPTFVRVNWVLQRGGLPELPNSARDVKCCGWASIFSGEDFLRFKADPADILQFVRKSGLKCATKRPDGLPSPAPPHHPAWFQPSQQCSFYEIKSPHGYTGWLCVESSGLILAWVLWS
jgi:hypothetical protein